MAIVTDPTTQQQLLEKAQAAADAARHAAEAPGSLSRAALC